MKYTITINQKSVIDNGWDLGLDHLAVLETVVSMVNSNKFISINDRNGTWHWCKVSLILEQLPILKIKERRCKDLISELCNYGLLETNPDNQKLSAHYIRIGGNYEKYLFFDTKQNNADLSNNLPPYAKNCIDPMQKIAYPPMQKIAEYNNIDNYNNINNNNLSIGENSNFSDFQQSNPRSLEEENLTKLQRGAGGSAEKLAKRMQQFEEWYSKYPRKDGKADAMKKFQKLKEAEIKTILIHTEKYAEIRKGKEKQYTLKASNYLSQRCWEDEDFLEARTNNLVSRRTGKTSVLEFDNENREF